MRLGKLAAHCKQTFAYVVVIVAVVCAPVSVIVSVLRDASTTVTVVGVPAPPTVRVIACPAASDSVGIVVVNGHSTPEGPTVTVYNNKLVPLATFGVAVPATGVDTASTCVDVFGITTVDDSHGLVGGGDEGWGCTCSGLDSMSQGAVLVFSNTMGKGVMEK